MATLILLRILEKVASELRAAGLHPVTRLARRILGLVIRGITIQLDGLVLTGSVRHRGYLWQLQDGTHGAYMARLFRGVLRPGMVVCDIGAHIGYYSLLAAQCIGPGGKVFAFEPDPASFTFLTRNVEANHFASSIVIPIPKAVSDRSGYMPFYLHEDDRTRSSLFWHEEGAPHILVECVSLDDFFADTGRVDVIKMDIEGGELQALKGMERTLARSGTVTMFVECNHKALQAAGGDAWQLVTMLRHMGFTVQVIDEKAMELRPVSSELDRIKYVNLLCQR